MSERPRLTIPAFLTRVRTPVPCSYHPHLFHAPDDGDNDKGQRRRERTQLAVRLCRDCPVVRACRRWAREQGEHGIWGGETDRQRMAAGHRIRVFDPEEEPAVQVCG
ncbi:WhiB family transcriptional regulator [Streptomyces sp. NPDC005125]